MDPSRHHASTAEFVELLTGHQNALRALIISLLPGCSEVHDILQDTNVVLWEKRASFKPGSNFRAWAFAVARNKVMQYRDRQQRECRVLLSEKLVQAIVEARESTAPSQIEDKLRALQECLKRLSPSQRDLVDARYSKRLSLEAYSDRAGRSAPSLRVSLFRIRGTLRECIERTLNLEGGPA